MEIKVGDKVRSFDFARISRELEGEQACYVEGVVRAILKPGEPLSPETQALFDGANVSFGDCPRYAIKTTRRVFAGAELAAAEWVFPPVNGTQGMFGVCDGVEAV